MFNDHVMFPSQALGKFVYCALLTYLYEYVPGYRDGDFFVQIVFLH